MSKIVRIMVFCGECDSKVGEYENEITEKYPFWCDTCDGYVRTGKYPWRLETEIVEVKLK